MSIIYGDARSLYDDLLRFITRSGKQVHVNGNEYYIEHSQFGSFDIQQAFETIVEKTTADPRESPSFNLNFREKVAPDIEACIVSHKMKHFYEKREYFEPIDLESVMTDYYRGYQENKENADDGRRSRKYIKPAAESREEAIAEVISLMLAQEAAIMTFINFNVEGLPLGDTNSDDVPNEDVDTKLAAFGLQDTVNKLHGQRPLSQPNPTLHTVQALYEIYDEIGVNPSVREVYGIFVNPTPLDYYNPRDADSQEAQTQIASSVDSMLGMGGGNSTRKWINPNEPDIETLNSYKRSD